VILQLPTGTGKSALIALLPFGLAKKKVLVLAPNLTLAKQLETDLEYINHPETSSYRKRGMFSDAELKEMAMFALRLEDGVNFGDIENHQIIIANYQQLNDLKKWFKNREAMIDLIIIDEAHHQKAETYQRIIEFFTDAKIIGLTATPFRSDGKKVEGKNVYTYHFRDAIKNGYIRNIKISNVTPQEIELSFSDESNKTYALDDIVRMKEEAWFRQGIALSQDCCDSIARKAVEKLNELKKDFPKSNHQIIAAAMSIRHAREFVKPAFEKTGLRVGIVSSEHSDTNDATLIKLKQGKIDVIINVGMLGEGFDHSHLGVAAIFRPFATLNPYIQFIGRAIRANGDTKHCYIVSHLGLNQTKRFDEFKLFDSDDQVFLKAMLFEEETVAKNEDDVFVDEDSESSEEEENTLKIKELGTEMMDFESQFVKNDDEAKISKVEQLIEGLSEDEKKALFERLGINYDSVSTERKGQFRPVDERKAAKKLLNEKEKSITTDIINSLGLKIMGRNFNFRFNNFVWVKQRVSKLVNERMGIAKDTRNELSLAQIEHFFDGKNLEAIKKDCQTYFQKKLAEKATRKTIPKPIIKRRRFSR
jgi:superfamily II DNA or RNA helicase